MVFLAMFHEVSMNTRAREPHSVEPAAVPGDRGTEAPFSDWLERHSPPLWGVRILRFFGFYWLEWSCRVCNLNNQTNGAECVFLQ